MPLIRIMVALDSYREATTAAGRNRQVVQSDSHRAVEQTPGSVIRQQMLGVVGSREKIRRTAEKSPVRLPSGRPQMGLSTAAPKIPWSGAHNRVAPVLASGLNKRDVK
jgi:hypothetical protein